MQIERAMPAREIAASWTATVGIFDRVRRPYLLY